MAVKQLNVKANKEYWDSLWEQNSYDKTKLYARSFRQYEIMKKFSDKKHPILEGGCGLSHWVDIFNEENYDIYGVDYAPKVVEMINKKKPELKISLGDVFNLNFKDEFFGTYFSWGVVEHFEEGPEKIIKEANRVLKPGGKLLISVPFWNKSRKKYYGDVKSIGDGDFYQYLFEKKEFSKILENNGFKIKKVYPLNWIKCYRQLRKNNSSKNSQTKFKTKSIIKRDNNIKTLLKKFLIKIQDFRLFTNQMGHMILFVAQKKY